MKEKTVLALKKAEMYGRIVKERNQGNKTRNNTRNNNLIPQDRLSKTARAPENYSEGVDTEEKSEYTYVKIFFIIKISKHPKEPHSLLNILVNQASEATFVGVKIHL